jgi:phosphopantetheine adenylyltransferase
MKIQLHIKHKKLLKRAVQVANIYKIIKIKFMINIYNNKVLNKNHRILKIFLTQPISEENNN